MSRAINDTATFEVLIAHAVPDLVTNVLILVGTGILLFVITLCWRRLPLYPYRFWYWVREYLPKSSSEFPGGAGKTWDLNAVVQDNISGIKEIQAFNQQSREKKRVKKGKKIHFRNTSCFKGKCDISSRCGNDKLPWNGYCRGLWRMVCIKRLCQHG